MFFPSVLTHPFRFDSPAESTLRRIWHLLLSTVARQSLPLFCGGRRGGSYFFGIALHCTLAMIPPSCAQCSWWVPDNRREAYIRCTAYLQCPPKIQNLPCGNKPEENAVNTELFSVLGGKLEKRLDTSPWKQRKMPTPGIEPGTFRSSV